MPRGVYDRSKMKNKASKKQSSAIADSLNPKSKRKSKAAVTAATTISTTATNSGHTNTISVPSVWAPADAATSNLEYLNTLSKLHQLTSINLAQLSETARRPIMEAIERLSSRLADILASEFPNKVAASSDSASDPDDAEEEDEIDDKSDAEVSDTTPAILSSKNGKTVSVLPAPVPFNG